MTFKKSVLVLANVTATSEALRRALTEQAAREPTTFRLVVPASSAGGLQEASATLGRAAGQLGEAGLDVTGSVGHSDPIIAVSEIWDPRSYDEIIVSTLPMGLSKWLRAGLPERIGKLTGAPVKHIVAEPTKPPVHAVASKPHTWGGTLALLGAPAPVGARAPVRDRPSEPEAREAG